MTTPAGTIAAGAAATVAWETMRLNDSRHLVVTSADGQVEGIVSAGDLGGKHGAALREPRQVADLLTGHVVTATPHTTVREAANLMRGHDILALPVLEDGKLKGIVTAFDLLGLIGRGAERPVATSKRYVLKDRGVRPGNRGRHATKGG